MGRRMTPEQDSFPESTRLGVLTMRLNAVTKGFREAQAAYVEAGEPQREAMHPLLCQLRASGVKLREEIDAILFGEDA